MAEPDSWSERERMEKRKAQDERVIQEWKRTNGGNSDALKHVRKFVEHVRGDIGVDGVIVDVDAIPTNGGYEIKAGYYMELDPLNNLQALGSSAAQLSAQSAGGACVLGTSFEGDDMVPQGGVGRSYADGGPPSGGGQVGRRVRSEDGVDEAPHTASGSATASA
ncbi:hypothetical protein [Saccharopolyspora sp. ASAGF58]|uniref:hypothetical protein n=1 Tax=Saccharopolyspora sp. ASAGF58 TaxID=2719023 RepID=UPI0014400C2F|nr:hypothetical protein [Saccharopolyspora sp. ASAGF58]QIZ35615.1 hypothetical protein FDZ84_14105 [Saccharopolyspora sp. ASAGF58]